MSILRSSAVPLSLYWGLRAAARRRRLLPRACRAHLRFVAGRRTARGAGERVTAVGEPAGEKVIDLILYDSRPNNSSSEQ